MVVGKVRKESWTKPFSEKTGEMLDYEVRKMITYVLTLFLRSVATRLTWSSCRNAYDRTRNLLTHHRADVEKVAKLLLEKEVITRYVTPCRFRFFFLSLIQRHT